MVDLPNDPIPTPIAISEPHAMRSSKPIVCEFCHCHLAPNGDVLKRGDLATDFQKSADTIDKLKTALAECERERDEYRAQLASTKKEERGFFLG